MMIRTQLYPHFDMQDPTAKQEAVHRLEEGITEISCWMAAKSLKLNEEKTEFLTVMSKQYQMKATNTVLPLFIGGYSIMPSSSVRNLRAVFDQEMSMVPHIKKTAQKMFFSIRTIKN